MKRRLLALVLPVLLCFGGPLWAEERARTILVLDASGSMWGQIDGKAKITIAQEVVAGLLQTIPEDQALGLTAYGHRRKGDCTDIETLVVPGTGSRAAIEAAVNAIKPKGKTPLSAAVVAAAEELKYTEEAATVILVSDGKETCDFDPCEVGKKLEEAGVDFTAHVIGFDVAKRSDRAQLQCLAENTGGTFRTASNAAELTQALEVVAQPQPPAERRVRFEAIEGERGPRVTDGLRWSLTNLDTGEVIRDLEAAARLDLQLVPGNYLAEVLRASNETTAEKKVRVSRNTDATFTLVLPKIQYSATLQGVSPVLAGAMMEIHWTGPDDENDFIATTPQGFENKDYITYSYTKDGSPLALRAPPKPGKYAIRYFHGPTDEDIGRASFEVLPVDSSLDAPEQAAAGATIEVDWVGPDYERDYISVAEVGSKNTKYLTYSYTRHGAPLELQMPAEPGEYEIRYVMNQGATILAKRPISVGSVSARINAPVRAVVGEPVVINWTGPDYERDYISVGTPESKATRYLGYQYTRHGDGLSLVMPLNPGTYEIRYVQNQDNKILARHTIVVEPLIVTLNAPATAPVGATITVDWDGPGYERDYLAVAEVGAKDSKYIFYTYTRQGDTLSLMMPPKPGDYEIRYIANGSPDRMLAAIPIRVDAVEMGLSAPDTGPAGGEVEVSFSGPYNTRDYVAIGKVGDRNYSHYAYTSKGGPVMLQLPESPGTYEIRYVLNAGDTVIARREIVVK